MGSFGGAFDSPVVASAITWGASAPTRCANARRRCKELHEMVDFEHRLVKRWSGGAFIKAGLATMAAGFLPIGLYTLFGPADGNPIGLGLLMVVLVPVGFLLAGVGVMRLLIAWLTRR